MKFKKVHTEASAFFAAVVLVCLILSGCASTKVPQCFSEQPVVQVPYKNVIFDYDAAGKTKITEKEMEEDLEIIRYLLQYGYCGYQEAVSKGFDLDKVINDIRERSLAEKDFEGKVNSNTFNYICSLVMAENLPLNDTHLGFSGRSVVSKRSICYTNIFFEKKGDEYFVCKSDVPEITEGMKYTGNVENLFVYFEQEKKLYRFAAITKKAVKTVSISLDGEKYYSKIIEKKYPATISAKGGVRVTDKSLYCSMADCTFNYGNKTYGKAGAKSYEKLLAKAKENAHDKANIIFDLRTNSGGRYEYCAGLLTSVFFPKAGDLTNDYKELFEKNFSDNTFDVISPVTMQLWDYGKSISPEFYEKFYSEAYRNKKDSKSSAMKKYPCWYLEPVDFSYLQISEFPQSWFKGDVYVLMDMYTASAAEYFIAMLYELENPNIRIHLIGENSHGAVNYVEVSDFVIPNSNGWIHLPQTYCESKVFKENPNFAGESLGWTPELWTTNDNLLNSLIQITGDKDLEKALDGLNKKMLQ